MATATEAAASPGERRDRGSADERHGPGDGGPNRRRSRLGAALRACWPGTWTWMTDPLRRGPATGTDIMARPRRSPPGPDQAPALDLGDVGWVVDTPPTGLPAVQPTTGPGRAPVRTPAAVPPAGRAPGCRPRPPAAAVVGASARGLPDGGHLRRAPDPPPLLPRPGAPSRLPVAAAVGPDPGTRTRGSARPVTWPGWRMTVVGVVWVGLTAHWLADPLVRWTDVVTFGTLLALAALVLVAGRRPGARAHDDLREIWTLPIALLLPPVYALVTHLPLCLAALGPGGRNAATPDDDPTAGVAIPSTRAARPREDRPAAARPAVAGRPRAAGGGRRRAYEAAALGAAGAVASWLHGLLAASDGPYTAESLVGSPGRLAVVAAAALCYPVARRVLLASPGRSARRRRVSTRSPVDACEGAPPDPSGPALTGRLPAAATRPRPSAAAGRIPSQIPAAVAAAAGGHAAGHPADAVAAAAGGPGWPGWWRAHAATGPATVPGCGRGLRWRAVRRPSTRVDVARLCSGVAIAALWATNPLLLFAAVPPVLLLAGSLPPDELLAAARTDPKTGLANVTWWSEVAEAELARSRRSGRPLSVLLVDIDHFKQVNDRHGHLFGDTVLVAVADALRAATRPWDLVGRFGGEEFVVLLTDVDLPTAADVAERIRHQVAAIRCPLDGPPTATATATGGVDGGGGGQAVAVTVSVGVAACGPPGGLAAAVGAADAALYRAKAAGRDRVHLAAPIPVDAMPVPVDAVTAGAGPVDLAGARAAGEPMAPAAAPALPVSPAPTEP